MAERVRSIGDPFGFGEPPHPDACDRFVPAAGGAQHWCDTCGWRRDLHRLSARDGSALPAAGPAGGSVR